MNQRRRRGNQIIEASEDNINPETQQSNVTHTHTRSTKLRRANTDNRTSNPNLNAEQSIADQVWSYQQSYAQISAEHINRTENITYNHTRNSYNKPRHTQRHIIYEHLHVY